MNRLTVDTTKVEFLIDGGELGVEEAPSTRNAGAPVFATQWSG